MRYRYQAFTLVEMLVVLVIISVVITFAALSLNLLNNHRRVKLVASQLRQSILAAEQQAILMPQVLSLKLTSHGYQFYQYVHDDRGLYWKVLPKDQLSHPNIFSQYHVIGKIISLDHKKQERIIFSDSGDVTPYQIRISDGKGDSMKLTSSEGIPK